MSHQTNTTLSGLSCGAKLFLLPYDYLSSRAVRLVDVLTEGGTCITREVAEACALEMKDKLLCLERDPMGAEAADLAQRVSSKLFGSLDGLTAIELEVAQLARQPNEARAGLTVTGAVVELQSTHHERSGYSVVHALTWDGISKQVYCHRIPRGAPALELGTKLRISYGARGKPYVEVEQKA